MKNNMKRTFAAALAALSLISATGMTAAFAESAPDQTTAAIGMANPWCEVDSLDALNNAAGVQMKLPAGATDMVYRLMDTAEMKLAEVTFQHNGVQYTMRATTNLDCDASGVYTEGGTLFDPDQLSMAFMDTDTAKLARWTTFDAQYILIAENNTGMNASDFMDVLNEIHDEKDEVNNWAVLPCDEESESGVANDYTAILEPYYDALDDMRTPELAEDMRAHMEDYQDVLFAIDSGKFGYVLKDLDGDGNPELIVTTMTPDDPYYGKMVLLVATSDGKEGTVVFQSRERARYYYAGDNRFAFVGSNSAFDSTETTYALEHGQLTDLGTVTPESDYVQLRVEQIRVD